MKRFGLVGASGYIAPRHMKAIADTGNDLVVAMDVNDSVGILDSHFPEAEFFTDFELFDAFVNYERRHGRKLDYISIATPNFLHHANMQHALRSDAHAICEKPLLLDVKNIDELKTVEAETGRSVSTILQLRLHPSIIALRERIASSPKDKKADVNLTYITSRGKWYLKSWKGELSKSGGIATNIGVHFFDMLHFVFGELQQNIVHLSTPTKAAGYLEYEQARVRWFLSLDVADVPDADRKNGKRTFRAINVDGKSIEFSDGFTDLHTRSYEKILEGQGFTLEDNRVAIETVSHIRNAQLDPASDLMHPFARTQL